MNIKRTTQTRLSKILSLAPEFQTILLSDMNLDRKRIELRNWLSLKLFETYEENPDIHPLEYLLMRDAINVLRKILSYRNEKLCGYGFLEYVNSVLKNESGFPPPGPGFLAEFEHLIRGVMCKTGIYREKPPAFARHTGRKAAVLRSSDLSRMARISSRYLNRYECGLDGNAIRRRSRNKYRILDYFNATELEWEKHTWHLNHIIRDAETLGDLIKLSPDEQEAVKLARKSRIPFGITPYYLTLLDHEPAGLRDRAVRAQVIPSLNYVRRMADHKARADCSMDFMLEHETSPIEGITRRYPNIVILKPVITCPQICVYCQRNWEIEDVYSTQAALSQAKLDKALDWIKRTPEISEVLITGGDPLLLSNRKLEAIVSRVAANPNVLRIRIGTRTPVTLPQRITESLVRGISRFHIPGKREIIIMTHFEHPYEITPQAMEAVQKFRRVGMEIYNQLVYTHFVSRKFEAALLRQKLRLIGVTPYYTFNTKGKEETNDYRVPIARLMQEQNEEARLMPGTVRTDEIVFNVPGLGKNYLKASQHHDVISILPDGRRIYEFHPWEKKLALANTYCYQDIAIHDYLERLRAEGEDLADYKTIWYYY